MIHLVKRALGRHLHHLRYSPDLEVSSQTDPNSLPKLQMIRRGLHLVRDLKKEKTIFREYYKSENLQVGFIPASWTLRMKVRERQ
jgi:hypothetical protein